MMQHLFLPGADLASVALCPAYQDWLKKWLSSVYESINNGDVAASQCLQGIISELALYGRPTSDWCGVMDRYLLSGQQEPIAYSEAYGKRLAGFAPWHQSPVHAVHARWWIEKQCGAPCAASLDFCSIMESLQQPDGWIYNPKVSETIVSHRMRSELMMSMAMGAEIFTACEVLDKHQTALEAALSTQPVSLYLSAECFRLTALETLGAMNLAPVGLAKVLPPCEAGEGYCDFSVSLKKDDYMGTVKRTQRDLAVHSSISALHAACVAHHCDRETKAVVKSRLVSFAKHLQKQPFDISAFKIRDLAEIPFGTDLTALEIIASAIVVQRYGSQ